MSDTTTQGIRIQVESSYLEERSRPEARQFLFTYEITISNVGSAPAKLISRHWVVSDQWGQTQHVRGPGVVGEQPRLAPGESFVYNSFCPLGTEVGAMEGEFQMVRDDGNNFDARIDPFTLAAPHALN
jgi:ApaG protein